MQQEIWQGARDGPPLPDLMIFQCICSIGYELLLINRLFDIEMRLYELNIYKKFSYIFFQTYFLPSLGLLVQNTKGLGVILVVYKIEIS